MGRRYAVSFPDFCFLLLHLSSQIWPCNRSANGCVFLLILLKPSQSEFAYAEFDQRLAAIEAQDVTLILKQVRNRAHTDWNTNLSSMNPTIKQELYMTLLFNALADTPVVPSDRVETQWPWRSRRDCRVTYGDLEAAKFVYFEIEVGLRALILLLRL